MPKCKQGHPAGLVLSCESCGAPISYADELSSLAELPRPEIEYEDVTVVFLGVPPFPKTGVHSSEVSLGPKEERSPERCTLKNVGGTWLNYSRAYGRRVESWLKLTGFYESSFKIIVVDATSPLSVLLLNSLYSADGVLVFAISADGTSNPVDQNTSYVAAEVMKRKGVSTIVASGTFARGMTHLTENEGLLVGSSAVQQLISYLVDSIHPLQNFIQKDFGLGIKDHFYSLVMSASDYVFRSPRDAFAVQGSQMSVERVLDDVQSAYLIACAGEEQSAEIATEFARYSSGMRNLLTTGGSLNRKATSLGFYDLLLLYGVRDARIQEPIEKGYLTVKNSANDLGVEKLEAPV